jgi:hypothetical protein
MWTLCPENVDETQRTSHFANQRMAAMFFDRTGLAMIDMLPPTQKMDAEYYTEHRAYYTISGFDILSNRRELPTEKMRYSF